jgi:DNA polymerase delta subunit 4
MLNMITVHQEDLNTHEKVLRHFDICSQYGPCVGIPRVKRWRRAKNLGLSPPIEVLAVLMKDEETAKGREWNGQRAYVDELMNTHHLID